MDVTREQLAGAVSALGTVTVNGCSTDLHDNAYGALAYPDTVTDILWSALADGRPAARPADAEIAAIVSILAVLDSLAGESGAGIRSETRVIAFIADRYGYVPDDQD